MRFYRSVDAKLVEMTAEELDEFQTRQKIIQPPQSPQKRPRKKPVQARTPAPAPVPLPSPPIPLKTPVQPCKRLITPEEKRARKTDLARERRQGLTGQEATEYRTKRNALAREWRGSLPPEAKEVANQRRIEKYRQQDDEQREAMNAKRRARQTDEQREAANTKRRARRAAQTV